MVNCRRVSGQLLEVVVAEVVAALQLQAGAEAQVAVVRQQQAAVAAVRVAALRQLQAAVAEVQVVAVAVPSTIPF